MTSARPADVLAGLALFFRGFALVVRRGRLFGLGLVPPLLTSMLFVTLLVTLVWQAPLLAVTLTPFAEGAPYAEALRALTATALVLATGLLLVLIFATVTLAIGGPLYDRISWAVDAPSRGQQAVAEPTLGRGVLLAVGRVLRTASITVPVSLALLLVGLIPLIGTAAAVIGSGLFGGWMVALDLMGSAADRRGFHALVERHGLARRNPWLTLGFGIPAFAVMSIPFVAVVAFPIVTAVGTLLVRRLTGESST